MKAEADEGVREEQRKSQALRLAKTEKPWPCVR